MHKNTHAYPHAWHMCAKRHAYENTCIRTCIRKYMHTHTHTENKCIRTCTRKHIHTHRHMHDQAVCFLFFRREQLANAHSMYWPIHVHVWECMYSDGPLLVYCVNHHRVGTWTLACTHTYACLYMDAGTPTACFLFLTSTITALKFSDQQTYPYVYVWIYIYIYIYI